jgi:hypothetical protein
MAGIGRRVGELVDLIPVLLVVVISEAASILHFYPEVGGVVAGLLLLVALGSLLVVAVSWAYFSTLPLGLGVRSSRRLSRRERRRGRRLPLSMRLQEWLYSQGGIRIASFVVLLLFLTSLSVVFLVASEAVLSIYREIFSLLPESIQPYFRSMYGLVRPMMELEAVEKCLLVQNLPAIFVAVGSLVLSRLRR